MTESVLVRQPTDLYLPGEGPAPQSWAPSHLSSLPLLQEQCLGWRGVWLQPRLDRKVDQSTMEEPDQLSPLQSTILP